MSQFQVPEWELLSELHSIIKTSKLSIHFIHVKSHQDDKIQYDLLPLPAQLNINADKLAEDQRQQSYTSPLYSPRLKYTKIQVYIGVSTITQNAAHAITEQYQKRESEHYLIDWHHWNQRTLYNINQKAVEYGLNENKCLQTIQKLCNGILPTNFLQNKYNTSICWICPACKCEIETTDHLFQCT